jgi:hypothetical protein
MEFFHKAFFSYDLINPHEGHSVRSGRPVVGSGLSVSRRQGLLVDDFVIETVEAIPLLFFSFSAQFNIQSARKARFGLVWGLMIATAVDRRRS